MGAVFTWLNVTKKGKETRSQLLDYAASVYGEVKEKGKKAILSGNDRYREFLSQQKISTQPDINVRFNSGDRLLEVFSEQ